MSDTSSSGSEVAMAEAPRKHQQDAQQNGYAPTAAAAAAASVTATGLASPASTGASPHVSSPTHADAARGGGSSSDEEEHRTRKNGSAVGSAPFANSDEERRASAALLAATPVGSAPAGASPAATAADAAGDDDGFLTPGVSFTGALGRAAPAPEAQGRNAVALPRAAAAAAAVMDDASLAAAAALKIPPPTPAIDPASIPASAAFPIWVGTWNMGAKEMSFPPAAKGQPVGARNPTEAFAAWIPRGYRLYVIGLQESISEATYRALDAHFALPEMDCIRLLLPANGASPEDASAASAAAAGSSAGAAAASAAQASSATGTVKVEGRGDGSFLKPKCTSLAVWVSRSARGLVSHCASQGLSLGFTQGSKGGAAIALRIVDSTFVFVSVHLSSTTVQARRQCYSDLVESVGNALGEKYYQLLEQFHHVIFLGDANFRLAGIGAAEAVKFMQRGDVGGLLRFDELLGEMRTGSCFANFLEAPIDFFPTYKKHENRPAVAHASAHGGALLGHECNIYWVHEVYKTIYKEPWYKSPSGKSAQRVPSWCDRIIRHSLPNQAQRLRVLEFHPLESSSPQPSDPCASPRIGGTGSINTYRALDHALISSDHTAVSCGFQFSLPCHVDYPALRTAGMQGLLTQPPQHFFVPPPHAVVAAAIAAQQQQQQQARAAAAAAASAAGDSPTAAAAVTAGGRSTSNSVSSPTALSLLSALPRVLVVRLYSVRILVPPASASAPPFASFPSPITHHPRITGGAGAGSGGSGLVSSASFAPAFPSELLEQASEPKYVRILFPAPFENGIATPFASRQVTFAPPGSSSSTAPGSPLTATANSSSTSSSVANTPAGAGRARQGSTEPPQQMLPPSALPEGSNTAAAAAGSSSGAIASPAASHAHSGSNGLLAPPSPSPSGAAAVGRVSPALESSPLGPLVSKAEFRCVAFDDSAHYARLGGTVAAVAAAAASAVAADSSSSTAPAAAAPYELPSPAPFHFLLKLHAHDGLSGQCAVPLPRSAFEDGSTVLEFVESLSRNGVTLLQPSTRLPIRVHFVLGLSSSAATATAPPPPQAQASPGAAPRGLAASPLGRQQSETGNLGRR